MDLLQTFLYNFYFFRGFWSYAAVRQLTANLHVQTVQQQVQAANWSLDLLIGVLLGQPAERSAARAPGKIPALRDKKSKVLSWHSQGSSGEKKNQATGLTVCRMRMWASSRTSAVTTWRKQKRKMGGSFGQKPSPCALKIQGCVMKGLQPKNSQTTIEICESCCAVAT